MNTKLGRAQRKKSRPTLVRREGINKQQNKPRERPSGVQREMNPTNIREDSVRPLTLGRRSGTAMSCGVGRRHGSDPELLWLWCRPAAVTLIRPLAWEPPYVVGVALKSKIKKKKKYPQCLA